MLDKIKNKLLEDKKIIILVAILFIFTIAYFISINGFSYAFSTEYDTEYAYKTTVDTIKKSAITYATNNQDIFSEDKIVYMKVQDLINNNILATNSDGNVINPINGNSLNEHLIKIKKDKDKITAELE